MTTAKNDVLFDYDSKMFCWEVDKNLVGGEESNRVGGILPEGVRD